MAVPGPVELFANSKPYIQPWDRLSYLLNGFKFSHEMTLLKYLLIWWNLESGTLYSTLKCRLKDLLIRKLIFRL